jgi:hypothetical protein
MPDFTVKINVPENFIKMIASDFFHHLFNIIINDHDFKVYSLSGLRKEELIEALVNNEIFQNKILMEVFHRGNSVIESDEFWEHTDVVVFNDTLCSDIPEYASLFEWLKECEKIVDDSVKTDIDCAQAMQILKNAGFKIIREEAV